MYCFQFPAAALILGIIPGCDITTYAGTSSDEQQRKKSGSTAIHTTHLYDRPHLTCVCAGSIEGAAVCYGESYSSAGG